MAAQLSTSKTILRLETLGFGTMLVLIWITEVVGVPHRFFHEPEGFVWTRVLFRSGVILVIWTFVHFTNRRLLRRLHELEEFLLVCSWCRRVGHKGEWLSMEEFFNSRLKTSTSHGICPDCADREFNKIQVTRVEPLAK